MAFPSILTTSSGFDSSSVLSRNVGLPSGTVAGELLLLFFGNDGVPASPPSISGGGWDTLFQQSQTTAAAGVLAAYYRFADGTEPSSLTITTSQNEAAAWTCYRITGVSSGRPPINSSRPAATTQTPNPPSHDPSGVTGAEDFLWFVAVGVDAGVKVSGYPANYDLGQLNPGFTNSIGFAVGSAARQLNTDVEDADVFTLNALEQTVCVSVAVRPAPSTAFYQLYPPKTQIVYV